MKNLFPLILMLTFIGVLNAQNIDYNRVILPADVRFPSVEEKLVQLAWANHPDNKILLNDVESKSFNIANKKGKWLERVLIQGNLNEFTIAGGDDIRSQFFPRYNFGVTIPLGMFIQVPQDVKIAKKEYESAIESVNAQKLYIRSETLKRYQNYQRQKEIYDIQNQLSQDIESQFLLVETKFKNGEETLENYTRTLERINMQKINLLNSKYELNVAKIELEEMIGLKLEEVL